MDSKKQLSRRSNRGLPVISKQSLLELDGKYVRQVATFLDAKVEVTATKLFEIGSSDLLHFHENPHISFILNGGVIDKRHNVETERLSGELMFFHAGEHHQSIYKLFPAANISIEISDSMFAGNMAGEAILNESLLKNPNAKFTILKIYRELLMHDEFSDCSIEMMLLNLFLNETRTRNAHPRWLETVIELLNDNWNEPLSLTELSEAANVYPTTISKFFPKYVSCTLGEYRRRLKIERSLSYVKTSTLSLTDIAYHCGFADQSHFTRTFKQITGFLPRQYSAL